MRLCPRGGRAISLLALAVGPFVVPVVAAASPAMLGGQSQAMQELRQQLQQLQFDASRFDSVTANTLRSILEGAAELGLPTKPLINLALQGAAQRANGERIIAVVRRHAAALSDAREALGSGATMDEIDAGAHALRAGIDERTLTGLRSARPVGRLDMPLVVLTDIIQRGVPVANAREAVMTIARLPNSDPSLNGLRETVAKNSIRGPGMALDALNRYVRGTVSGNAPPSTPATPDRKPIRPPTP